MCQNRIFNWTVIRKTFPELDIFVKMSKNFKYGEKKNKKRKQRMLHNNINKHISNSYLNNRTMEDVSIGESLEENANSGLDVENINEDVITVDEIVIRSNMQMEDNLPDDGAVENMLVEVIDSGESADVIGDNILNSLVMDVSDLNSNDAAEEVQSITNADKLIEGRRIVEMNFLVNQFREISDHNPETCTFNDVQIEKEIRNGLRTKIIFRCTKCNQCFEVFNSEAIDTNHAMSINSSAILASNMVGIGYSQLQQFASVLDVPVMCADNFKNLNDKVGGFWEETALQSMREAAEEERKAAIERGDIDDMDGIPHITVVVDGAWSKRSYNKNYSALSGVVAIIGLHTGKILWIGVKNKYCVTCVRSANKNLPSPPHFCTKNYSGPSSDMEWRGLVEGFQSSVELHNLRYLKMVADGDSSTYAKIMEAKPYGDRYIEKHECKNHLLRNFRKQIEADTKGCPRGLNKHVCNNLDRIRKDVSSAINYRKSENTPENQKAHLLKSDMQNIIHHVFGDHSNCPTYIKEHCKEDNNFIPALIQCGTYEKMSKTMRRLMYCASDLILGHTNNPAEHYNSIVAKFVGGKRINFSLSNSYKYKANAASVQYNKKLPLSAFYKTVFNTNPPVVANKIQLKRLQKTQQEKQRRKRNKENNIIPKCFNRKKETGLGYGGHQSLYVASVDYENEKQKFFETLKRNQENSISNEEQTRDNDKCTLWIKISSTVIMASDFGSICRARNLGLQTKNILKSCKFAQSKAMKHDKESQPIAQKQLAREQNICIQRCGLLIDSEIMYLAASPTGTVNESDMIVHIECPSTIFSMDPNRHSVLVKLPYMETEKDKKTILGLKKSHVLYYQIQGQLHISQKNVCLFSIWTSTHHEMYVERIPRDETFFVSKMKPKLDLFYNEWLLPELIECRLKQNMQIRGVPNS